MKRILVVFGTRPEAIKMCPLVNELKLEKNFQTIVCVTGQHKQMLDQVLNVFKIVPDYNLHVMKKNQTLFDITNSILLEMRHIFEKTNPDMVLVHGDTSTSFAAALAAYYMEIPVGHVEAGLRTYNLYSPFPEEFNRQAVGIIAKCHFAPTQKAKENLLNERKKECDIYVTGNTAIDALKTTVSKEYTHPILDWAKGSKLVLLTAHRRENLGKPLYNMFKAIRRIVEENKEVKVVYPVHLNPNVRRVASDILSNQERIKLIEPLDVIDFHNFMANAYMILTDSGGIQEEAPSLGKPVLVMRDTTERPEGVEAGTLKLVGTSEEKIYEEFRTLLNSRTEYLKMSNASNPYGDGTASRQIVEIIRRVL